MNPIKSIAEAVALSVAFSSIGGDDRAFAQQPVAEIAICGDMMPSQIRAANASFEVFYEVKTNASGKVITVNKLKNDRFSDESYVRCLRKWTLPVIDATVTISSRWEHSKGWTRFSINMPGHPARHVAIAPGWPY
jgi:hypothetical protein